MTSCGKVSGELIDGVTRFLGIPYAADPVGPLRCQAPQPPLPWDGVRDCTAFSATPPKAGYRPPFDELLPEVNIAGDDWLSLNVWSPGLTGEAPVMVWIHGGAFRNGNSAMPVYDGQSFARDGVVLVSINYRLGVDGFALLPDAPANRGLLDQVAALEWVRDNIAAFGGDPGNVTIFGESAGAISVMLLLGMPKARGLFAKAIAQSGATQAGAAPDDARRVTAELTAALGAEATASNIAAIDIETLLAAQTAVGDALAANPDPARWGPTIAASSLAAFVPVVDGDVVPVHPQAAVRAGAGADVPLMIGTNTEEFRFFLVPSGVASIVTDENLPGFLAAFGVSADVAALYRENRPGATAGDVLCALITDSFFRMSAYRVAEARAADPGATYFYEFAWPSPVADLGAAHAIEIPFVFDNLAAAGAKNLTGDEPPAELAGQMHATWVRFASDGNPGWEPFDSSYPVMTFGVAAPSVVLDPRGDERRIWSRHTRTAP